MRIPYTFIHVYTKLTHPYDSAGSFNDYNGPFRTNLNDINSKVINKELLVLTLVEKNFYFY